MFGKMMRAQQKVSDKPARKATRGTTKPRSKTQGKPRTTIDDRQLEGIRATIMALTAKLETVKIENASLQVQIREIGSVGADELDRVKELILKLDQSVTLDCVMKSSKFVGLRNKWHFSEKTRALRDKMVEATISTIRDLLLLDLGGGG